MKFLTNLLIIILTTTVDFTYSQVKYTTVGCYKDAVIRDLPYNIIVRSPAMTYEKCANHCSNNRYRYAGTQYSKECYCGNSFGRYGPSTKCSLPCSGNASQICGSGLTNNVLDLNPEVPYKEIFVQGCYKDEESVRDLPYEKIDDDSMTYELCAQHCIAKEYRYAAVEYGISCFCGRSFGRYGNSTDCNLKCGGNHLDICGGNLSHTVLDTNFYEPAPANCKHTQEGQEYLGHLSVTRDNKTCVPWSTIITVLGLHVPPDAFPDGSVEAAKNYCRNPEISLIGPYCITSISPPDDVEFGHCDVPFCPTDSTILPTTTPESISIQSTTEKITTEPSTTETSTTEPSTTETSTTEPSTTESSKTNTPPKNCKYTQMGQEYLGHMNVTINNEACVPWSSSFMTSAKGFSFPDGSDEAAQNYCRNPNGNQNGPWCFTTISPVPSSSTRTPQCKIPLCPPDSTILPTTIPESTSIQSTTESSTTETSTTESITFESITTETSITAASTTETSTTETSTTELITTESSTTGTSTTESSTTESSTTDTGACRIVWLVDGSTRSGSPLDGILTDIKDKDLCKKNCIDDEKCQAVEFRYKTSECLKHYNVRSGFLGETVEMSVLYTIVRCSRGPTTCRFNDHGYEYVGLKNETHRQRICYPWKDHSGPRSDNSSIFSDGDAEDAKNFCRNPNRDPLGLWCYTSKLGDSYEYCDIPFCPGMSCTQTGSNIEYTGTISVTKNGMVCDSWTNTYAENAGYLFPDGSVAAAQNFCRIPTYVGIPLRSVPGTWCFVEFSPYIKSDGCQTICTSPDSTTLPTTTPESTRIQSTTESSTTETSTTELITTESSTTGTSTIESSTTESSTTDTGACRVVWQVDGSTRSGSPVDGILTYISDKDLCKKNCIDDEKCQAVEFRYKTYECLKHYNVRSGILEDTVEMSVLYTIVRCSRGPTTCRFNEHGYEYVGLKDETRNKIKCQPWKDHSGPRSDINSIFPDGDAGDAKNYCRNPNRDPIGPWCYNGEWERSYDYCEIPFCPGMSCTQPGSNIEYTGTISVTKTGMVCDSWTNTYAEYAGYIFPDGSVAAAQNFCRIPNYVGIPLRSVPGTWCFVEFSPYIKSDDCQTICTTPDTTTLPTTTPESTSILSTTESKTTESSTTEPSTTESITTESSTTESSTAESSTTESSTTETTPDTTILSTTTLATTSIPSTTESITTESSFMTCRFTADGYEYVGREDVSSRGTECQYWKNHQGYRSDSSSKFPDGDDVDAKNYCRNPNKDALGPWCYTSTVDNSYEYCAIPYCRPTTCRFSTDGFEYVGMKDKTNSGRTCLQWNLFSVLGTLKNSIFPDGNELNAKNYCRNPDGKSKGPWCYVHRGLFHNSFEYCDIPFCPLVTTIIKGVDQLVDDVLDSKILGGVGGLIG